MVKIWLVAFVFATSTSGQQFHEPSAGVPQAVPGTIPGTAPKARGPSPKRHHHQDIHLDLEKEREHIKAQVKNDYIDTEKMDDNSLLMQYFRKHDTDNNLKLDGLELLKAIAGMDDDHHHDDDDETGEGAEAAEEDDAPKSTFKVDEIIPIVDSILEQDDKNKDGYINWPEFISRQKQR